MQLAKLNINMTHSKINMDSSRPTIQIRQPKPDFAMKTEHATVEISKQASRLYIDQTQAFADANLKHIFELNKEFAKRGHEIALEQAGKYAREGDLLMKTKGGGKIIADLAKENSRNYSKKEFSLQLMPRPFSVKVGYQPSDISLKVKGFTDVQVNKNDPKFYYQPWKTNIYLQQKANIKFNVVGLNVEQKI